MQNCLQLLRVPITNKSQHQTFHRQKSWKDEKLLQFITRSKEDKRSKTESVFLSSRRQTVQMSELRTLRITPEVR